MEKLKVPDFIMLERVENFIGGVMFKDVNLKSVLYSKHHDIDGKHLNIGWRPIPDLERVPFDVGHKGPFNQVKEGQQFGPAWSTHWFKVDVAIPESWDGLPVILFWNHEGEGLVWTHDGKPVQGLYGGNSDTSRVEFPVTSKARTGDKHTFYIECACNGLFGAGWGALIAPPDPDFSFALKEAKLKCPNKAAWDLYHDMQILVGMAKDLEKGSPLAHEALLVANRCVNIFDSRNEETWKEAHAMASRFFEGRQYFDKSQTVIASGHCHIDTAWLWPWAETRRKAARSWSSQIALMRTYPEHKFTFSQAQQMEWVAHDYPELFTEVQKLTEEGRFIPVGGTWVEMDGNLPSGESLIRQFLYGQRFFEKYFGLRSDIMWLPDTFGYAAQLPQIFDMCGCPNFVSQKLSWNNINKFPHTSFNWVGLDGTKILAHFPPSNTYCAEVWPSEIIATVSQNKDKGHTKKNMLLYGVGDGGGGPTRTMLERLKRVSSLAETRVGHPKEVFDHLHTVKEKLPDWNGELYFELHRGTYTSHAWTKRNNRKLECRLHDLELIASIVSIKSLGCTAGLGSPYPKSDLDILWKHLLLNQFHDVLPGSSIGLVYKDSSSMFKAAFDLADRRLVEQMKALQYHVTGRLDALVVMNTTPFTRSEVVRVEAPDSVFSGLAQTDDTNASFVYVRDIPPWSIQALHPADVSDSVVGTADGDQYVLQNRHMRVAFDSTGCLVSLRTKSPDGDLRQEFMAGPGNQFMYYEDIPLYWDAWDVEVYHLDKSWRANAGVVKKLISGPLVASITVESRLSETSSLRQVISLTADGKVLEFSCDIDWDESHKLLKVVFPFEISSNFSNSEVQYGHLQRPTHFNTSWDVAKFEITAQRFIDLSEAGRGVALLNDCKYGFSVQGNVMTMSVLRSPKSPDKYCDIGQHVLRYGIYPHQRAFLDSDVVEEGYKFNYPLVAVGHEPTANESSIDCLRIFTVVAVEPDRNTLIMDNLKKREDPLADGSHAYVLRLYEAYGARGLAEIRSVLPLKRVLVTNGLEDELDQSEYQPATALREFASNSISLTYKPFQVISLIVQFLEH